METKSVTLVVDGEGLFPDAPTIRGAKHMGSLAKAAGEGHRAAAVFVVQRDDAVALAPNDNADPQFGVALRQAEGVGVCLRLPCGRGADSAGGPASREAVKEMPHGKAAIRPEAAKGHRAADKGGTLIDVYQRLGDRYGPQHWWPGESLLEIIVGAILTQATAWTNVEKALLNLKSAGLLSIHALRDIPEGDLAQILRPSGFFRSKARRVKAFIVYLWDKYGGDLEGFLARETPDLREELLSIHGIGEETADDIIVYAAAKPSFVIDSYTRRILKRLGLAPKHDSYKAYQQLFHQGLPADPVLYNEFHALLDRHGKETCKKEPLCGGCCLLELCPTGRYSIDTPRHGTI